MTTTRIERAEHSANQALAAAATQAIATRMQLEAERREWAHVLRRSNPGRRTVIRLGFLRQLAATLGA